MATAGAALRGRKRSVDLDRSSASFVENPKERSEREVQHFFPPESLPGGEILILITDSRIIPAKIGNELIPNIRFDVRELTKHFLDSQASFPSIPTAFALAAETVILPPQPLRDRNPIVHCHSIGKNKLLFESSIETDRPLRGIILGAVVLG